MAPIFGPIFQQLRLPPSTQDQVLGILAEPERQMDQELTAAVQAGRLPVPPSPEALQTQAALQEQQLRAALGDSGYAAFRRYQESVPDRLVVEVANGQGANLTDAQTQQVLQVLGDARRQVMAGPAPAAGDANQAVVALQQQQALMNQTVQQRVQGVLSPQQAATLQEVLTNEFGVQPKSR
jgi:hypothetical protein